MSFLLGALLGLSGVIFCVMLVIWAFALLWYAIKLICTVLWYAAAILILFAVFAVFF